MLGLIEWWGERRNKMKPNLLPMNLQMFAEEDGGTNFTFDDFKAFVESNEKHKICTITVTISCR